MSRDDFTPIADDEIVSLARFYRRESLATLVAVSRDQSAPASARAQAASRLLEYSDGRPSQARQITVADIGQMSASLREELLSALLLHYQVELPDQFRSMIVDQAMALHQAHQAALAQQAALPKPNRFKRQAPVAAEPPPSDPAAEAIRGDLSAKVDAPGGLTPETARPPLSAALMGSTTPRGRGPDPANRLDTPYVQSLAAQNSERRRRQDSAPTLNSPPPTPPPSPQDAAVRASNGIVPDGNVVVLPGTARGPSLTGNYYYDPATGKLEKQWP
jgi:hypothetical protein